MNRKERIYDVYESYEEQDGSFLQIKATELAPRLQQFQAGEFYKKTYPIKMGTSVMQRFLDALREAGLDIGQSDSIFGYKMPIPQKKELERDLIIFRRR